MKTALAFIVLCATVTATEIAEVNEYRRQHGLPPFAEDPRMTAFAQHKARYRASRRLRNGHAGPMSHWAEGTGEMPLSWGNFATCLMLSDHPVAGAGSCVGNDGLRYCVLVCRGGTGRNLRSGPGRTVRTSYMTRNQQRLGQPYYREPARYTQRQAVTPRVYSAPVYQAAHPMFRYHQ